MGAENPILIFDLPRRDGLVFNVRINEGIESIDVLDWLFDSIEKKLGPVYVETKAYTDVPHGIDSAPVYGEARMNNSLLGLFPVVRDGLGQLNPPIIPSVSGVFYTQNGEKFVVPMLDLELTSTGLEEQQIHADLCKVVECLQELGFSGLFLNSGSSYQFIADFAMPYSPWYWKIMGYYMTNLVDHGNTHPEAFLNIINSVNFGQMLIESQSLEEAKAISKKILTTFESIPTGEIRQGLLADVRWIAHKILEDANYLVRVTESKSYKRPPILVGDLS